MPRAKFCFCLLSVLCWLHLADAACLTDPMMQGQDPAVTLQNGLYHLVQSDGCNIHLRRSSTIGGLVTASDSVIFSPGCMEVWAPELHWINNRWYLYYSMNPGNGHRVYVAESQGTSATGPYVWRGVLFNNFWNIDGNVLRGPGGQLYYLCSGIATNGGAQNIYIAPMNSPTNLGGSLSMLSTPDQAWERNGLVNEGPWGFQRDGRYFIVYSASGCWTDDYTLGLLTFTGTNLLDRASWTKTGPLFTKRPGAYGPGHNCVVTDTAGQWWNIYHANNNTGEGCGGLRKIRAQRFYWDANNMPWFGTPVPTNSLVQEDASFLVARLPFFETSGATAANYVCGPPATLQGGPVWANPGLRLDGTNDFADCGAGLGNDVQNSVTLAAWVRPEGFSDWAGLVVKGSNASPYALQTWSDGSLRFSANWGTPAGATGAGSWNSAAKMTDGVWQHVAVTYDGVKIRFYLNAVADSAETAQVLRFGVVNEPLYIGADFPGGDEFFKGTIRDVRVYGRALSAAEIKTISGINTAPVLVPVPDQSLLAGQTLAVTNVATDAEAPPQILSFSLLSGPPGASVNAANGVFTWRPAIAQAGTTNPVAVAVSDNGAPILSATQSFQVAVLRPAAPAFGPVGFDGGVMQVAVTGDVGPDYSIYASTSLTAAEWALLLVTNPPALPFLFVDPAATNFPQRYYRVQLGP